MNAKHHHSSGDRSCESDDSDRTRERKRPQQQEQEHMCAIGYAQGKKSLTKSLMLMCWVIGDVHVGGTASTPAVLASSLKSGTS